MKRSSLGVLGLLLLLGCQSETFEERVARLRDGYTITSGGFVVKQTPPPPAAPAATAPETLPDAATPAGEATAEEDGILIEDLLPVRQDVLLDLSVRNDNVRGSLPGLTLEVTQVDAAGNEKEHWRAWIDTSGIERGPGAQLAHELEDVEFVEGDSFHIEVRSPVPPAERSEYREFTPE